MNDLDPITVTHSNNAFSEQQKKDQSEHFSFAKFHWQNV
jgi:hypothetical protein